MVVNMMIILEEGFDSRNQSICIRTYMYVKIKFDWLIFFSILILLTKINQLEKFYL
jgi:hypothetical protein